MPVLNETALGYVVTVDGWTVDIVSLGLLGRSVCSNGVLGRNIAVSVA